MGAAYETYVKHNPQNRNKGKMRKQSTMKKIILSMVLLLGMVVSVMAQDTYEWKKYKMQFTVPSGMELLKNDGDGVVMKGTDMSFGISGLKKAIDFDKLSDEELQELILEFCKETKIDPQNADSREIECNNGYGVFVLGERTDMEGWYSLFSFLESSVSKKMAVVIICFKEELSEEAGKILGGITFK